MKKWLLAAMFLCILTTRAGMALPEKSRIRPLAPPPATESPAPRSIIESMHLLMRALQHDAAIFEKILDIYLDNGGHWDTLKSRVDQLHASLKRTQTL